MFRLNSSTEKKEVSTDGGTTWANFSSGSVALIPAMTSATTPSGIVSSKDFFTGYDAYKAFDQNINTEAASATTAAGWWIRYEFPEPKVVDCLLILHRIGNSYLTSFKLQGSNNNTDWTDLGSFTNNIAGNLQDLTPTLTGAYKSYQIFVVDNAGGGSGARYIQMYGS